MNNEIHNVNDILAQVLNLQESGYACGQFQYDSTSGVVNIIPLDSGGPKLQDMINVLTAILVSGHVLVMFSQEYNEELNKYSLLMHPVIEEEYEPYKVNLKQIELN